LPESLLERADEKAKRPVEASSGKRMFSALRATLN
jgi:hypothetical protein